MVAPARGQTGPTWLLPAPTRVLRRLLVQARARLVVESAADRRTGRAGEASRSSDAAALALVGLQANW